MYNKDDAFEDYEDIIRQAFSDYLADNYPYFIGNWEDNLKYQDRYEDFKEEWLYKYLL